MTDRLVAVVGPFSGPRATWGELLRAAATPTPDVRWEWHDDRGDAETARSLAERIAGSDRFDAVIGHFNSLGALAALPVYASAGLPLILPLSTRTGLLDAHPGAALRWCPDDSAQIDRVCRAARSDGHRVLVIAHDGSPNGRGLAGEFAAHPDPSPPLRLIGDEVITVPADAGIVVCGTHVGVAGHLRALRAANPTSACYVTDDCAVAEFARLVGAEGRGTSVISMRGGAAGRVRSAFTALISALTASVTRSRLLDEIRTASGLGFTATGELSRAAMRDLWDVVPVSASPPIGDPRARDRVVVVGAGVVGALTAARLAESGLEVSVVSGDDDTSATHYSGGLLRAYAGCPDQRRLATRSMTDFWTRQRDDVHRVGSVTVLGPDVDPTPDLGPLLDAGLRVEVLSGAEITRRWPGVTVAPDAVAVWEPDAGYATAPRVTAAAINRALRHGARVERALVRALRPTDDGVELVRDHSVDQADAVVLAAGTGTADLLAGLPDSVRFDPGALRTKRIRYAFFDTGGLDLPTVDDPTTGLWGRPTVEGPFAGAYLTGRPVDEWDVPATGGDQVSPEEVEHLRELAVRRWPWLITASCVGGRFGTDVHRRAGPLITGIPGTRIIVATGFSGAGFKTAPAVAERVSTLVRTVLAGESREVTCPPRTRSTT